MFDVVGFGNSVLDIIVDVEDDFIKQNNLTKGNFLLIGDEESKNFNEILKGKKAIHFPGGSVSNIIAGITILGGNTAYIGGIGNDENGKEYLDSTTKEGIQNLFVQKEGNTGVCLTFITTDGERTFAVNLGKCNYISHDEVDTNFETKIMLIEG